MSKDNSNVGRSGIDKSNHDQPSGCFTQAEWEAQLEAEVERNFPVEWACVNGQNEVKTFRRGR